LQIHAVVQAQREASAALTELGLSHATAVVANGGLLKPDLVVMTPTARVALTLDQPSAFSINPPHRPLGDTILNWRLLVLNEWQASHPPPRLSFSIVRSTNFDMRRTFFPTAAARSDGLAIPFHLSAMPHSVHVQAA
jgi:hypothetical protein